VSQSLINRHVRPEDVRGSGGINERILKLRNRLRYVGRALAALPEAKGVSHNAKHSFLPGLDKETYEGSFRPLYPRQRDFPTMQNIPFFQD
jgi:hypothetical protein